MGHISCQVRYPSHYIQHEPKFSVIMAIEAENPNVDPELDGLLINSKRWIQVTQGNCDQFIFADFLTIVLRDIEKIISPIVGIIQDLLRRILFCFTIFPK